MAVVIRGRHRWGIPWNSLLERGEKLLNPPAIFPVARQLINMNHNTPSPVLVDRAVLSDAYLPDRLAGRQTQAHEISRCLSPAMQSFGPAHLWLHGRPGTGKTTTVTRLLAELQKTEGVPNVAVNCWQKDTYFEVVDDIVRQLRILRADENRTATKLEKLRRHLEGRRFLIVLDEIDRVCPSERSAAIYNLLSLEGVGLICISSSPQALLELEERVRSRLSPHVIQFPSYSPEEVTQILMYRAAAGLVPDAWSDQTLAQISSVAQGDARVAIRALRKAVAMADAENREKISVRPLKKQWDQQRRIRQEHLLSTLTEDHRLLCEVVARRGEILSGDLRQEYLRRCETIGRKPIASRTFSKYVNTLVQKGLVASEQARVKGKVRLFKAAE